MLQHTYGVHGDTLCVLRNMLPQSVQALQPIRNYLEIRGLYFR